MTDRLLLLSTCGTSLLSYGASADAPGSTHELYAWSDGATGRLFGHYDASGVFVFDRLAGICHDPQEAAARGLQRALVGG